MPICRRLPRASAVAALAAAAVCGLACRGAATAPRWNVLLVVVDTLRADHLESYGYHRPTAPNLAAFGARAIRFERTFSQAGCTFPSVNSLLTSRYPSAFTDQPYRNFGIPEHTITLAEMLRDEGFATHAVSASMVVRETPAPHNDVGGFGRGFDNFHEDCMLQDAACVNAEARRFLDQVEQPFFLFLHYLEPHGPYQPPAGHQRVFAADRAPSARAFIARGEPGPIMRMIYNQGPDLDLQPAELAHLVALYDEEIRYFDGQLSALLTTLDARGLRDRTLIVLASDHGEALLEQGDIAHCHSLVHNAVIATPLWIAVPGQPGGERSSLAQNLDIVPTVLDYLGLDPAQPLDGRSLRPVIEHRRRVNRYAFSAEGVRRAVIGERYKLVLDLETAAWSLYDYRDDPGESRDLAASHPRVANRLRRVLDAWRRRHDTGDARRAIDDAHAVEERLRALGYL